MATLVPSLQRMWNEVNARWPNRDHWSDGWLGDTRHSHLVSDHNPDAMGRVHANDTDATISHVMGSGPVGDEVCRALLRLARSGRSHPINYIIYRSTIYSRAYGFRARAYTGINHHDSHVHCSVLHTDFARNWKGWWGILDTRKTLDISKVIYAFSGHPASRPVHVQRVQNRLVSLGWLAKPYHHGYAGRKTKNALKGWQKKHGYKADGIPGAAQVRALAGSVYRVVS